MAALASITALRPTSDTTTPERVDYGATISAGQPLYKDTADGLYKLAANTSAALASVRAIAVTPGVSGGQGFVVRGGSVILVGTTAAKGTTYYVGAAGEWVPEGDLSTGKFVTRLGTASSTTQIKLAFDATGIDHA